MGTRRHWAFAEAWEWWRRQKRWERARSSRELSDRTSAEMIPGVAIAGDSGRAVVGESCVRSALARETVED